MRNWKPGEAASTLVELRSLCMILLSAEPPESPRAELWKKREEAIEWALDRLEVQARLLLEQCQSIKDLIDELDQAVALIGDMSMALSTQDPRYARAVDFMTAIITARRSGV